MSDQQQNVTTVFDIADEKAQRKMKGMAKQAEELDKAVENAKQSVSGLPGGGGGGGGGNTPHGAARGGISQEEKAAFAEAKAERKLRKQRMLVEKVEIQKEQVLHRVAETALMSVIAEQNKLAAGLARGGATLQGLGTSMAGFGGTMGAVGSVLTKFGGYAALAGLAVEGAVSIMEAFGVDVEGLGHDMKKFGMDLLHMKSAETLAHSMGFLTEEDMKAAQQMEKMWSAEAELTRQLQFHAGELPKWPVMETAQSMQEFHEKALALAKEMPGSMKLEDKVAKIEAAAKGSLASMDARHSREMALSNEIDRNIIPHLQALPTAATQEKMEQLNTVISGYVQSLVDTQMVTQAEAAATAEQIKAKLTERGSIYNVVEQFKRNEATQSVMDSEIKKQVKHLKVIPFSASVGRLAQFNNTLAQMAQHMAEVSHYTPKQTEEYLNKLKEAADEKRHKVFDFRGSRFDIRQQFADQDPDRIAVAFSNDLAQMGERKLSSALAPLWGM